MKTNNGLNQKLHYYLVVVDDGKAKANAYLGLYHQRMTLSYLAEAKKLAKMPSDSVVTNASYLGFMTQDEFKDGER